MAVNWSYRYVGTMEATHIEETNEIDWDYREERIVASGTPGVLQLTYVGPDEYYSFPDPEECPLPRIAWFTFRPDYDIEISEQTREAFKRIGVTEDETILLEVQQSRYARYNIPGRFYDCEMLIFSDAVLPENFPRDEYGALNRQDREELRALFPRSRIIEDDAYLAVERYATSKRLLINLKSVDEELEVLVEDHYQVW